MKLNSFEFFLMNNPIRAASQRRIETPLLIGPPGTLSDLRVLEVGCGRGVGMEILLALGASQVVGFDLDPKMVALKKKRTARYGERAVVFVGDAESVNLPDASFDAVVDYGILHHVPDWREALREVARLLKPNGSFYFEDIFKASTQLLLVRALTDHPMDTQFTGEEFRLGMQQAGLRIEKWWQFGNWLATGQALKPREQH